MCYNCRNSIVFSNNVSDLLMVSVCIALHSSQFCLLAIDKYAKWAFLAKGVKIWEELIQIHEISNVIYQIWNMVVAAFFTALICRSERQVQNATMLCLIGLSERTWLQTRWRLNGFRIKKRTTLKQIWLMLPPPFSFFWAI